MQKKVLIVTALAGFIKRFLDNDIKILQDKGYKVVCAANLDHPGNEGVAEYLNERDVEFVNINFSSHRPVSRNTLQAYKDVKKLIRENDFDMVHVHTPIAGLVTKLAAKKARKNGTKVIYTVHGFYFHKKSSLKNKIVFKTAEKWSSKYSDMIITINREDYKQAQKMKSLEAKYISGMGVDTSRFNIEIDRDAYREKIGVEKDDIMVLSIGELSQRKNHRVIIEALAKLNDPKYVYVICGNDMSKKGTSSFLKKLAEEKNVRLKLLGLRDDIPEICKCADIGAFPSSREGLGLAGIEMLASGLPIVATKIQGINDYLVDGVNGYGYDADDADGFAEGIRKLSDKSVRDSMRADCIKSTEKFEMKKSNEQMLKIYNSILPDENKPKVMHYSLGLPPYRTGGMTKFCTDLIQREREMGYRVSLLWPGRIKTTSKRTKIREQKKLHGIENFEIYNPLPVSLNAGINRVDEYTKTCENPETFEKIIDEQKPDVIHLHTLMGIHREFLESAKKKGIRLVYSTHDYFGICPRIILFREGKVCDTVESCENCPVCNTKAISPVKIKMLQSHFYRKIKDTKLLKAIRVNFKGRFFHEEEEQTAVENMAPVSDYVRLKDFYKNMFNNIDYFHFNSSQTGEVYRKYLDKCEGRDISIFHNDIIDRREKNEMGDKIIIGFNSKDITGKGYFMLVDVLRELWDEGERWFTLRMYGNVAAEEPFIESLPRYSYGEMDKVYRDMDILAMPSLWYETFGFTVLEAFSFGVPVIITENVGSKDVVKDGEYGDIIKVDKDALKEEIMSLKDGAKIKKYNENLLNADIDFDFKENVNKLLELYK